MEIIRSAMSSSDSISFGNIQGNNDNFYVIYSPVSGSGGILKFLCNQNGKWLLDFVSLNETDLNCGLDLEVLQHHIHLTDTKISVSGNNLTKIEGDPICKHCENHKEKDIITNDEKIYCDIGI